MKNAQKFVLKFFIAVVLLVGIVGCDGCNQPQKESVVKADEVKNIIITDQQAKTRFDNYGEHRAKIIKIYEDNGRRFGDSVPQNKQYNKGEKQGDNPEKQQVENGFVPVQYTDYNFEDFKTYLKFIEQQTKKAGYDIASMRIYFANYPENEGGDDKRKRNTVMFVPTIDIGGSESAYYISDEGEGGVPRPFLLTDSLVRINKPAPTGNIGTAENTNEANLLPNFNNSPPPVPFYLVQSVIGNEGHRNP